MILFGAKNNSGSGGKMAACYTFSIFGAGIGYQALNFLIQDTF